MGLFIQDQKMGRIIYGLANIKKVKNRQIVSFVTSVTLKYINNPIGVDIDDNKGEKNV